MSSGDSMSSKVWFNYPQNVSLLSRLLRTRKLQGTLNITNDCIELTLNDNTLILKAETSELKKVTVFIPALELYFKDGTKFSLSFDRNVPIGNVLRTSKESIDNTGPFIDYFKEKGLLKDVFGKKVQ